MENETDNLEKPKSKLKLAKTNSLERELNSTITKAVHEKYGSEADLDELARERKRTTRIKAFSLILTLMLAVVALLIWIKNGNFSSKKPEVYKDLVTAFSNFTVKPNADENLAIMAMALAKFSSTAKKTDYDVLATGYAVFAVQEIKAGYIELGITDSKQTIANFPESPCTENLEKIVAGVVCETCHGKGLVLETCDLCNGSGLCTQCKGKKTIIVGLSGVELKCNKCNGTGNCTRCLGNRKIEKECKRCKGSGNVFDEKIFNKELTKIMTKALGSLAYNHTKSEVIDVLNKIQKRLNK